MGLFIILTYMVSQYKPETDTTSSGSLMALVARCVILILFWQKLPSLSRKRTLIFHFCVALCCFWLFYITV